MKTPNYVFIYMKKLKQKWDKGGMLVFYRGKDKLEITSSGGYPVYILYGEWREDEITEAINIYNSKTKQHV